MKGNRRKLSEQELAHLIKKNEEKLQKLQKILEEETNNGADDKESRLEKFFSSEENTAVFPEEELFENKPEKTPPKKSEEIDQIEDKLVLEKKNAIKLSMYDKNSKELNSLYKLDEQQIQENKAFQAQNLKRYYDPNRVDSLNFSDFQNIMHLSKKDQDLPDLYKQIELPDELKKFNVGNKLTNQIVTSLENRRRLQNAMKRGVGSYVIESAKRGRLGVDMYIILFGVFGTFFITYYYYQKNAPVKKMAMTAGNRKVIDDVMEKAENSKYDIDEISLHENHNNLYKKEFEDFKIKKFKMQKEIRKLEKELYSDDED